MGGNFHEKLKVLRINSHGVNFSTSVQLSSTVLNLCARYPTKVPHHAVSS